MNPYSFGVASLGLVVGVPGQAAGEPAMDPNQFYPALPGFTVMAEAPPAAAQAPTFSGSLYGVTKLNAFVDPSNYAAHAAMRALIGRTIEQGSQLGDRNRQLSADQLQGQLRIGDAFNLRMQGGRGVTQGRYQREVVPV